MREEDRDLLSAHALPVPDRAATVAAARPSGIPSESAFGDVYEKYVPILRKIAMRKFGVPRAEVDSLVHDVFTTYLAQRDRVRELHPYLVGGICNAAREYWRKASRDHDLFRDASVSTVPADDQLLESVAQNQLVRMAVSRLGTSCRETLRRFYLDGESAAAIAQSRQTTQNSILRLLHYCRERVRAAYLALTEGDQ